MSQDTEALALAIALATSPGFDGLHDPNRATAPIEPYHDDAGYPTIGFGHLLSREPWASLSRWPAITIEEAHRLLRGDMALALAAALRLCPVATRACQRAALADFAFNAGAGALQSSTLRQRVNRRDYVGAAEQFGRWIYAGGRPMAGLVRRRAAERRLFLTEA